MNIGFSFLIVFKLTYRLGNLSLQNYPAVLKHYHDRKIVETLRRSVFTTRHIFTTPWTFEEKRLQFPSCAAIGNHSKRCLRQDFAAFFASLLQRFWQNFALGGITGITIWFGSGGPASPDLQFSPCRKRSPAKGVWQKSDAKSDRSVRKSDRKVTESVPKTKKVIELLLPTSFCGTLNNFWHVPLLRETKDTVRVSLQEYLFTGSSKVTSCGFWHKRVRLWDLLEGGLTVLQERTLTVLLVLPNCGRNYCIINSKPPKGPRRTKNATRSKFTARLSQKKNSRATTKGQDGFRTFSHFLTGFHTFPHLFRIFPPGLFLKLRLS